MEKTHIYKSIILVAFGLIISCKGDVKTSKPKYEKISLNLKNKLVDEGFQTLEQAVEYYDSLLLKTYYAEREIKKFLLSQPGGRMEDALELKQITNDALVSIRYQQETIAALILYYTNQTQHDLTQTIDSMTIGLSIGNACGTPFMNAHYYGDLELEDREIEILSGSLTVHGVITNNGQNITSAETSFGLITKICVNSDIIII